MGNWRRGIDDVLCWARLLCVSIDQNTVMLRTHSLVLIADDDNQIITQLRRLLGRGYQVAAAQRGSETLALADELLPDLVILDVLMPDMDGFTVCRALRANPRLAEIPILILTALDDRAARLQGIEAGADDFISKPFDSVELLTRIKTITRLNRFRQLLAERARVEALVERSPNGIVLLDAEGQIIMANPAFHQFLGQTATASTLIGRQFNALVAPPHADACAHLLGTVKANPAQTTRAELLFLGPAHTYLPAEVVAGDFSLNNLPQTQLIIQDIRERKRAELVMEAEHRRVAYELHDSLAQLASGSYNLLQAFAANYRPRSPQRRRELETMLSAAEAVARETRRLIAGLRPAALADFGLVAALRLQVDGLRASGMNISLNESSTGNTTGGRLSPDLENTLYWIAQEALANIRKHAQARQVEIQLDRLPTMIRLQIKDDGRGFAMEALDKSPEDGRGVGLLSMRERASWVGGQTSIRSAPGAGTLVEIDIPLEPTV